MTRGGVIPPAYLLVIVAAVVPAGVPVLWSPGALVRTDGRPLASLDIFACPLRLATILYTRRLLLAHRFAILLGFGSDLEETRNCRPHHRNFMSGIIEAPGALVDQAVHLRRDGFAAACASSTLAREARAPCNSP